MAPITRDSVGIDVAASTGHLIRRAAQRYSAIWADLLPGGLTSPQFGLLALLDSEGQLDQQTLGQRGALDKSTCGYLVDRMQRAGLVLSITDPTNRRRKLISLTGTGRDRLREASPVQQQVHAVALSELSERDRRELNRLLTKMLRLGPLGETEP